MVDTLLYLDEDLASSIALRFTDFMSSLLEMQIHIIHVIEPNEGEHPGVGWVRRTWRSELLEAGMATVSRLLKTEKVHPVFAGPPIIRIGVKDEQVLDELSRRRSDLYMEGYLSTSNPAGFYDRLQSPLYEQAPCPVMCVKNLAISSTAAVLVGDGVDLDALLRGLKPLLAEGSLELDVVYYRFEAQDDMAFIEDDVSAGQLDRCSSILEGAGARIKQRHAISGTPAAVSDFFMNYAFVASSMPRDRTRISDALACTPGSVLLCR